MNVAIGGDDQRLAEWAELVPLCGGRIAAAGSPPDAAIVGGSAEAVLAVVRGVGQSAPLFVLPFAKDAPTVAYALLPQVEDGRRVVPGWAQRNSLAVSEYLDRFTRGEFGDLRLLRLDRTQHVPSTPTAELLDPAAVDAAFFEDIDLLRLIGGDYNRITGLQIGAETSGVRQSTITLAADGAPEAVWTISPGKRTAWRLAVSGTHGSAELQGDDQGCVALQIGGETVVAATDDPARASLQAFLQDVNVPPTATLLDPRRADWTDYVRAADLLQGFHRSLRRRRTIDLHFESVSERSQFKTQMTAVGCGVLTWALLGACTGLVLGSLLDPRDGTERRAAAAGTIIWTSDFDGRQLSPETTARLTQQVAADGAETIILIERANGTSSSALDSDRLQGVTESLKAAAGGTLIPQVEVRPLAGRWFHWGMLAVWCATFAPLAVFLILQLLIAVTKPT